MMIYVIQTIGQRDVQLHYKKERTENEEASDYSGFDKHSMRKVQKKLQELIVDDKLIWKPIQGKEGRQDLTEDELIQNSKAICFPFLEHILEYLKKRYADKKFQFILLYNDRQHFNVDNKYIKNEPWFLAEVIRNFWREVCEHYEIAGDVKTINFCENMVSKWEIDTKFAFDIIDKISQKLSPIVGNSKILLFNDGGLPVISKAIDFIFPAYFPKQLSYMEQSYGNIFKNQQYLIQKKYSLKFSMLQSIKQFDFIGLYYDAEEMQLNSISPSLWSIILACKSLLYDENKLTESRITKSLKFKNNSSVVEVLKTMKKMASPKNALGCNLIRTIQEARKENWWSMSTMLISVGELFISNFFKHKYPKAVVKKSNFEWFKLDEFPFKIKVPSDKEKQWQNYKDKKLYLKNWPVFDLIIKAGLKSSDKKSFSKFNQFLNSIKKLKYKRNKFIHEGKSISKIEIEEYLQIRAKYNSRDYDLNSKTFKFLLKEVENLEEIDFVNWLPIMKNEIYNRILSLSPQKK